jgi:peptidoglycan/xylan/chitin deacetylase (PgdA/CDA1 family)
MRAISLGYHDVCEGARLLDRSWRHTVMYTLYRPDFQKHLASIHRLSRRPDISTINRFRRWDCNVPVFLTFDDGKQSGYTCVADDLEKYGWCGHFFITTDWIGKPGFLNRRQIRELHGRKHVIGSHSCLHPARMSHLSWEELMREWSESCAILSDILGEQVRVASVPDGYYSRNVGKAASTAGIEVLFTSEATASASTLDGCLILGRYFIQMHTPPSVSGAIAAGQIWPRLRQTVLWEAKKPIKWLTGESYATIRRGLINARAALKLQHRP